MEREQRLELRTSPEVENSKKIGSIIISASPGRGSTTVARELRDLLSFYKAPIRNIHMVGEISRRAYKRRTGQDIIGPHDRDQEIDKRIDAKTRTLVKTATPEELIIIEGQNAAVNAYLAEFDAQRRGERISPHYSVLLVCDPIVAGERVWEREKEKATTQGREFNKTLEDIIAENEARHQYNLPYYWNAVPFLGANRTDPHNPADPHARRLYTSVFDTTDAPAKYVAAQILVDIIDRKGIELPQTT